MVLRRSSEKEMLPWFRIINSKGFISLRPGEGYELQKKILEKEGLIFNKDASIDLNVYLWEPDMGSLL